MMPRKSESKLASLQKESTDSLISKKISSNKNGAGSGLYQLFTGKSSDSNHLQHQDSQSIKSKQSKISIDGIRQKPTLSQISKKLFLKHKKAKDEGSIMNSSKRVSVLSVQEKPINLEPRRSYMSMGFNAGHRPSIISNFSQEFKDPSDDDYFSTKSMEVSEN